MNSKELRTIYPPMAQWIFAAVGGLSYRAVALKFVFIVFDVGVVGLILALLDRRRRAEGAWKRCCSVAAMLARYRARPAVTPAGLQASSTGNTTAPTRVSAAGNILHSSSSQLTRVNNDEAKFILGAYLDWKKS